jgi:hypothetical protein
MALLCPLIPTVFLCTHFIKKWALKHQQKFRDRLQIFTEISLLGNFVAIWSREDPDGSSPSRLKWKFHSPLMTKTGGTDEVLVMGAQCWCLYMNTYCVLTRKPYKIRLVSSHFADLDSGKWGWDVKRVSGADSAGHSDTMSPPSHSWWLEDSRKILLVSWGWRRGLRRISVLALGV